MKLFVFDGFELVEDFLGCAALFLREIKEITDRKEAVIHKAIVNDGAGADIVRQRQDFGRVEIFHLACFVLRYDREVVEQDLDVALALSVFDMRRGDVNIGIFVNDLQHTVGCKVKNIGVGFVFRLAVQFITPWVLRAKGCLEVLFGRFEIVEH